MHIAIYVAIARNGVIGREGGLPWRLSSDLKRFKADTIGKPVIMGRKTWQGIGRPLPGRHNIVVTRDPDFRTEGADTVTSLQDAVTLARARSHCVTGVDEICIIGGGEIYAQALSHADRLCVTHVEGEVEGDTRFPPINPEIWRVVSSEPFAAGPKDTHATLYTVYERRPAVH